jgi:hypothetical protein
MHMRAHSALTVHGALPLHMHIAPLGACALCAAPSRTDLDLRKSSSSRSQKTEKDAVREQTDLARGGVRLRWNRRVGVATHSHRLAMNRPNPLNPQAALRSPDPLCNGRMAATLRPSRVAVSIAPRPGRTVRRVQRKECFPIGFSSGGGLGNVGRTRRPLTRRCVCA